MEVLYSRLAPEIPVNKYSSSSQTLEPRSVPHAPKTPFTFWHDVDRQGLLEQSCSGN